MPAQHLSDLRNLGPKSEEMLAAIDIHTPIQLAGFGAVAAFIALNQSGLWASLNMLWALEGALSDRDWRGVVRNDKLRLLTELQAQGVKV